MEKYRKLKEEIRRQNKAKVRLIKKVKREKLVEQGRKENKNIFVRKIAVTSGTLGVNFSVNVNDPALQHMIL